MGHHGLTLAMASGSLMLPVVVASMMSAEQTAYFSQARLLSDSALAIPYFLTIALFATAEDQEGFRRKARRTIVIGMVLALCLIVACRILRPNLVAALRRAIRSGITAAAVASAGCRAGSGDQGPLRCATPRSG